MGTIKPKLGTGSARRKPKLGTPRPKLGTRRARTSDDVDPSSGLAAALFGQTQQRVLSLLFGQPDRAFAKRELIGLVHGGSGAVQRELERLVRSGLCTEREQMGRRLVQANTTSPIFSELKGIVDKTFGIPGMLRSALEPFRDRIAFAALFGSIAKGTDRAASDIDILLVSEGVAYTDVYEALAGVEARIGRPINPTIYTPKELEKKRAEENYFITKVLAGTYTVLIGKLPDDPRA